MPHKRPHLIPMPPDVDEKLVAHLGTLTLAERVRFMVEYAATYRAWLLQNGLSVKRIRAKPGESTWVDKRLHSSRRTK